MGNIDHCCKKENVLPCLKITDCKSMDALLDVFNQSLKNSKTYRLEKIYNIHSYEGVARVRYCFIDEENNLIYTACSEGDVIVFHGSNKPEVLSESEFEETYKLV